MDMEDSRLFHAEGLPFTLMLEGFMRNSRPEQAPPVLAMGIDGIVLEPKAMEEEAERNIAGVTATVIAHPEGAFGEPADAVANAFQGGDTEVSYLWGMAAAPWITEVNGARYAIDLRHERHPVPFTIALDKFIHEKHPRTGLAANYESEVTMIEQDPDGGRHARKVEIKMNEPLRHEGYTFFQASFIEDPNNPRAPVASVFAVVNNPADQWPKYACYVIGFGLFIHFMQRLWIYLRSERKRQQHAVS